jgi:hypothetical protein
VSPFELVAYFGAVAGVAAYIVNFARHRTAARLLSSSGMFFTAAALAVLPHAFGVRDARDGWLVLLFLLLAVLAQSTAALRTRPSRDGRFERAGDLA